MITTTNSGMEIKRSFRHSQGTTDSVASSKSATTTGTTTTFAATSTITGTTAVGHQEEEFGVR